MGYTFTGWTGSNGNTPSKNVSILKGSTGNKLYVANYDINTYTISYELNGGTKGSKAPTSGTYGSTVQVSNPTRSNYTFTGWTVSGIGASLSGTNLTIGAGNITLTANWKINNTIPAFTYTGSYKIVNDSDQAITTSTGNWKIRFLTGGGGHGVDINTTSSDWNGKTNTGGGGKSYADGILNSGNGGKGGSGIVIIRNKR